MKKPSKKVVAGVALATAITGAATIVIKKHRAKATPKKEYDYDYDEERTHFDNDNANLFI